LRYITGESWRPAYLRPPANALAEPGWLTEREPWGAWHSANHDDRQEGRCFSVALHSNFYGARDRERTVDGDPRRTVVLGDSFAEGWGVETDERLSDLLEARDHREYLNFGIENAVGPLQYQILYERLAAKFAHDRVLVMFLPDNDFTDNDADFWRRLRPDFDRRYRPYYEAVGADDYRPFYPVPQPPDGFPDYPSVPPADWHAAFARWPKDNLWSAAMYRLIRARFFAHWGTYSGYLDYTPDELRAVLWSFAKIKSLAGDRPVTIAVIPRLADFWRVAETGDHRLIETLRRFGREHDIAIVDLMQEMPKIEPQVEAYYLPCDGHWSVTGNRVAAEALTAAMPVAQAAHPAPARP
jgi:hypothetical protein